MWGDLDACDVGIDLGIAADLVALAPIECTCRLDETLYQQAGIPKVLFAGDVEYSGRDVADKMFRQQLGIK